MNCLGCNHKIKSAVLFQGIDADFQESDRIPVLRCEHCGLVQSSIQKKQNANDLYFEGYYGEHASAQIGLLVRMFQIERRARSLGHLATGKILDVGCGDGIYLRCLPPNFQKYGFEPSVSGQKSLKANQINILDIFSPAANDLKSFDLITMWQSLEHIESPKPTLECLKKLVKDDGSLFVSVPNFGSWQARLFRSGWFHLDPTRHLVHYEMATLLKLFKETGWQVESVETLSFEYGVFGWWQSFFNLPFFEFNFAYKRLKRKTPVTNYFKAAVTSIFYGVFSVVLLPISLVATILESMFSKGGVLNVRLTPAKGPGLGS